MSEEILEINYKKPSRFIITEEEENHFRKYASSTQRATTAALKNLEAGYHTFTDTELSRQKDYLKAILEILDRS